MTDQSGDIIPRLPLLEKPRADAALTDDDAEVLVTFGLTAWSDHWASTALDWVDQGVRSEEVEAALRLCAHNETYSQATRHRARRYVKPKG